MPDIRADGLAFQYPDQPPLFEDLTFRIGHGTTALTGPSGSGKSTLLGILAGWLRPSHGDVSNLPSRTQWVLQSPIGSPRRSALSHVELPLLAAGTLLQDASAEAYDILARVGLDAVAERPLRHLSGGEAQRLMLARAMAAKPELMLVDEPTASLDATSAATVIEVIHALADIGMPIVIATHDLHLADACRSRIEVRR